MSEQELIVLLKKGDPSAYQTLVNTWQHLVYNTVLGIVQDVAEAEDVAQEVFIQVFRSIAGFRGDAKLSTWLYRIACTKALDRERKKKTQKKWAAIRSWMGETTYGERDIDFHHPGVLLDQKENAAMLFRALSDLPENQRICFLLIKTEGLSYEEVSEVMEVSVKSIEGLMHRAKQSLRKKLEHHYNR